MGEARKPHAEEMEQHEHHGDVRYRLVHLFHQTGRSSLSGHARRGLDFGNHTGK
jgi:hypothetical protein